SASASSVPSGTPTARSVVPTRLATRMGHGSRGSGNIAGRCLTPSPIRIDSRAAGRACSMRMATIRWGTLPTLLLAGLLGGGEASAAPTNDECAAAIVIGAIPFTDARDV